MQTFLDTTAPLFDDLLTQEIMRAQPIKCEAGESPPIQPSVNDMVVAVTPQGMREETLDHMALGDDYVVLKIPGDSKRMEALRNGHTPMTSVYQQLQERYRLHPLSEYCIAGIHSDPESLVTAHPREYRLFLTKNAYQALAVSVLEKLGNIEGRLDDTPALTIYWERLKRPDSALTRLIERIIRNSELPETLVRDKLLQPAIAKNNFEFAGVLQKAMSSRHQDLA